MGVVQISTYWGDTLLDVRTVDGSAPVELGDEAPSITQRVREVPRMRLRAPPLLARIDYRWLNWWMIAFFVHAAVCVVAVSRPRARGDLADELIRRSRRIVELRLIPAVSRALTPAAAPISLPAGGGGKRAGKIGRVDAQSSLAGLFAGTANGKIFGSGELDRALSDALGSVRGGKVEAGLAGYGTRATASGRLGGGGSVGPAPLSGIGGYSDFGGDPKTKLKKSTAEISVLSDEPPRVEGALDKEVIRAVIREMIPQIRYCYERELQRRPGLFGKVATELLISASGAVGAVKIVQSTLESGEVEQCMVRKIRSWVFPKPRGGGVVVVKYPFILRPAG